MYTNKEKGNLLTPSYPFRIEFEIISACNLNCIYCYAKPFANKIPQFKDLKYLFDKTEVEARPFEVILVGGEPFLRKDIIEVLQYVKDTFIGASIGVSTNGTLLSKLSEEQLAKLREISSGFPVVQVSLDSTDTSTNDKTRGLGRLTMEGIRVLEKHKIPFSVGIIPTVYNKEKINETVRLLLTEFQQLRTINIETLQPTYTMSAETFSGLRIKSDEQKILRKEIKEEVEASDRKDIRVSGEDSSQPYECSNPLIDSYGFTTCTAGLFRAGVFIDGTVTPCLLIRNVNLGNLFEEPWGAIWERSKSRFFGITEHAGQCTITNLLRKSKSKNEEKVKNIGL